MSIEVVCPSCETSHKVKDEAAGKKLRCKGCEKIISIPKAVGEAEADPWDSLDVNDAAAELPPVIRKSAGSKKKAAKRSKFSSGGGMPAAIMVSIGINGVQIAFMAALILINLLSGNFSSLGGGVRPAVDVMLIQGLLNRQKRVRWQAIVLDAIGLASVFFCLGPITYLSSQTPGSPAKNFFASGAGTAVVAGVAVQVVLWVVDLVLLFTRPAKDYCNQ